jgi:hypothetical protein
VIAGTHDEGGSSIAFATSQEANNSIWSVNLAARYLSTPCAVPSGNPFVTFVGGLVDCTFDEAILDISAVALVVDTIVQAVGLAMSIG